MKIDSRLSRFFFVSPWLFPLFFLIPLAVIFSVFFHAKLPFTGSKYPLLVNNVCFSLVMLSRVFYYVAGLAKSIRYGAAQGVPRQSTALTRTADAVRDALAAAGFVFDAHGTYGEKPEKGYLGTVLVYGGLFVVLATGSLDNLLQFSGTIQDGIGRVTDLQKLDNYKHVSVGPIKTDLSKLPKMRIVRQYFPSPKHPNGATEVAFRFPDGKEQQVVLKAPEPFRAGTYDIYMSRMVYEPRIAITIDNSVPVFNGTVSLQQLPENVNGFDFYGTFTEGLIDGEVYYQPDKSRLRVVVKQRGEQLLDTELIFQVDRLSRSANFAIMCERMGVWSEIYVVHRRHMPLIFLGAAVAIIGLLMRIMIRPQRVWLEEVPEGCRARVVGKEAEKLMRDGGEV